MCPAASYIKYPFADFHFRMFADIVSLLRGELRELAWIMRHAEG
jgi:hypothetical protein